jgi:hypothetical protein
MPSVEGSGLYPRAARFDAHEKLVKTAEKQGKVITSRVKFTRPKFVPRGHGYVFVVKAQAKFKKPKL